LALALTVREVYPVLTMAAAAALAVLQQQDAVYTDTAAHMVVAVLSVILRQNHVQVA
jgi:hypothetical protein